MTPAPPVVHTDFDSYFFDRSVLITRIAWLLTIALFVVFSLLDRLMLEEGQARAFQIRFFLAAPIALVFFLFSFSRRYREFSQAILCLGVLLIGVLVLWLVALPRPHELAFNFYGFAVTIYLLNILVLSRLRFKYALAAAAPILAAYLGIELLLNRKLDQPESTAFFLSQIFLLFSATSIGVFSGYYVEYFMRLDFEQKQQLHAAGVENETLLNSILPPEISARIKSGENPVAGRIDSASCFFSDLQGFTEFSRQNQPEKVVSLLNELYAAFDALLARHRVEKIKTIGDAYMAMTGLPSPHPRHAPALARFALEVRQCFIDFEERNRTGLKIRIGLHCGPVVAGVIGTSKFSYDVWGATINTASRLESSAKSNSIHISEDFAAQLGSEFHVEPHGRLALKGVGEIKTCFLIGID